MNSIDLNDPKIERIKDILRIGIFFIIAWIISETLKQANLIPEFYTLKIWVFSYLIPIRDIFIAVLGAVLTYIDRVKFLKDGKGLTFGK